MNCFGLWSGRLWCLGMVVLLSTTAAQAEVMIDWVTVGNPGNPRDPETGFGGVDYVYRIGKFEVTNAQYCEFLNAVAGTDTYDLYEGGIMRSGSPGSYTYAVVPGYANRPVNTVSYWNAMRFANWLHNGQPKGQQDKTTTEDGAYTLEFGFLEDTILRNPGAKVWIPSSNEWYKAAYHKNDGATAHYWNYPTESDTAPSNELLDPDPGNSANYTVRGAASVYTLGPPFWMTEVGEFENSASAYGTFDQAGNVEEWIDPLMYDALTRGGSYADEWASRFHIDGYALGFPDASSHVGFRVASIPEPTTSALLVVGALTLLLWGIWKQRR